MNRATSADRVAPTVKPLLRGRIGGVGLLVVCSMLILACTGTPSATPGSPDEGVQAAPETERGYWPRMAIRHNFYVCELAEESSVECQARIEIDKDGISQLPPARMLTTGQNHTCALGERGRVFCWGLNTNGQLGDPDDSAEWRSEPKPVPGISEATFVGADGQGTCAVIRASTIRCWGVLGDGSFQESTEPADIAELPGTRSVYFGWEHACALHESGEVYCWGANTSNQLGYEGGDLTYSDTPMKVPGIADAVYLGVGHHHSCALLLDGTIRCWGATQYGQLGDGGGSEGAPAKVAKLTNVIRLEVGDGHSCAMLEDRSVWCWGWNAFGQIGDGTLVDQAVPVRITDVDEIVAIAAGDADVCVKSADENILCWGENYDAVPTPLNF